MAYGMAGRSPMTGGTLKAPQQQLQRLSPGVYRNPEGELVNAQGGTLPSARPTTQPTPQSQMPMQTQPYGPPMAMRPTPGNMPQMPQFGGMMQPPQQGGMMQPPQFSPFANWMAQQPQEMQKQFAQQMQQPQPMMRPAVMPSYNPSMAGFSGAFLGQNK